ncbi:DNA polymerase III subunit delta' [Acinetobacter qingfengensis]|uniref:DNA-directed DNA polymerase n=1 Tax=Acinetobacter qingfengensis TaxID=1262585 RepID=A0A1E7RES6_9GAMM|nr:DNA polymerase III subunit delta' [Acinetobacter qingfengensis]KAA8735655.1 DNA polymerase III subunit delta' [Acinetobacter qingfengensis]OEY97899.1 DNA polymerase III subunit delta' [Acinetobacter qingfengensis]
MDIAALGQQQLLPWQQPIWQRLQQSFPEIGHGLLFYGKQGCGKQQFAAYFAKWLLCSHKTPQGACGQCNHCAWFAAGTHPQLKIIQAEFDEKKQSYAAIKIDQIREIADFVQQKVEGWRVVLLYPAENLNIAAANALLKTLEEPGDRIVLILMSDAMLRLPATIRSRVQQYALDRVTTQQAQDYLQQQGIKDVAQSQVALALAANMPLKAQQILDAEWFKHREAFIKDLTSLVQQKNYPMKFSAYWTKQMDIRDILVLLRYIVQDCIAYKLQQPMKQIDLNFDALQACYDLEQLFAIYAHINKIQIMLAQNVQAQLILDELTIQLMNIEQIRSDA